MKKLRFFGLLALLAWLSALGLGRLLAVPLGDGLAEETHLLAERLEQLGLEGEARELAEGVGGAGWDGAATRDDAATAPGATLLEGSQRRRFGSTVPAAGVVIGEAQVRDWGSARIVPRARSRGADGHLPAGLEVEGAKNFVPALENGDRLVAIDGAPVRSHQDAVRLVLEARGRNQPSIKATFARRTVRGTETFQVVVTQPYDTL